MLEKHFAAEVANSIERQLYKCSYRKIPDQIYNPMARFNPEKKYDAYVIYKGHHTSLEYKLHKTNNAFPLSAVRDIQKAALLEDFEAGANAYIIIGVRTPEIKEAYVVPINMFIDMQNNMTRKSIPIEELKKFCILKWLGSKSWAIPEQLFLKN